MKNVGNEILAILLLGPFAITFGIAATDNTGYKVSGIMGSEQGMAFAVIENADGEQQLLSEGSAIGKGFIKSISSKNKTVILSLPEGEFLLRLSGGTPDEAQEEEYSTSEFYEITEQKNLEPEIIGKLITLAKNAQKLDDHKITIQLNELLGLSEKARVVAYNEQTIKSTSALLAKIEVKLPGAGESSNFLGSIAVSDENGQKRRIYLTTGPTDE